MHILKIFREVKNVEIEIENSCSMEEKNISETLGFILLEGSRRKDENSAAQRIKKPSDGIELGGLDSLNMEDLDLDLDLSTEAPTESPQTQPEKVKEATVTDPVLAQFISLLSSFPEIMSATISTKDGSILHQSGEQNNNTANFITYVAGAAEQIGKAIGVSAQQYSLFTLDDESRLLVLCGQDVIVGIKVGSSAFPEPIADGLRPVLNRIKLQS